MKKNDWIFAVSILAYDILFWKQQSGLNVLLMNMFLLGGLLLKDKTLLSNRNWLIAAGAALASSFCVAMYGNGLSIFSNIISLLLAGSFVVNKKNSFLVAIFLSICSVGASIGFMIVDGIQRRNKKVAQSGINSMKKTLIVIVALIVVLIFFLMYRESNVLFFQLTEKINLDFISGGWCAFTIFGAILLYGFYYHHSIPGMSTWDAQHALQLAPTENQSWFDKLMGIDMENFSGVLLLALLNILLLFVNGLDTAFILDGKHQLPAGVTYTDYVHQGVGMLITSIVFAMLIILYYFRGRLNFSEKNKWLKILAMLWILQNAFMLLTTAWRNHGYIYLYGLTYKRIGVYIYLLLTLIGLITTAWKMSKKKTSAFLVRTNSWLFFGVMVFSCFINWDKVVLNSNLDRPQAQNLDYMATLSYSVLPGLINYENTHANDNETYEEGIQRRIFYFMSRMKFLQDQNKWQSTIFSKTATYNELMEMQQFGRNTSFDFQNYEFNTIYYFPGFSKTTSFDFSRTNIVSLGEIGQYKNLQTLRLTDDNKLKSLFGIENLQNLQYLFIEGTGLTDLGPLLKLPNLEVLQLNGISNEWRNKLMMVNPNLQIKIAY